VSELNPQTKEELLQDSSIKTINLQSLRQDSEQNMPNAQNGNLILTVYITLGSEPVRVQVHEFDNVDELA